MKRKLVFLNSFFVLSLLVFHISAKCGSIEKKDNSKNDTLQKIDTITLIFAASNYIYYYNNELTIDETTNNFKATINRYVKDVLERYRYESKEKDRQFIVILKIQNKEKLNDYSKSTIKTIKNSYKYKELKLNEVEKELVKITEQTFDIKSNK